MLISRSLLIGFLSLASLMANELMGGGSTFPQNVISKWTTDFEAQTQNQIIYLPMGSGLGMQHSQEDTLDFIVTEQPFTAEELESKDLTQVPFLVGGVVLSGNLGPGQKQDIALTPDVIYKIFFGQIRNWNDPLLQQINPGIPLPDLDIIVVRRSEPSGTTLLFTQYLAQNCPDAMKDNPPALMINSGVGVPIPGNEGVGLTIKKLEGSIGYVEYSFALRHRLFIFDLLTSDNSRRKAGPESFLGASTELMKNMSLSQPSSSSINAPGIISWPLMGISYLVFKRKVSSEKKKLLSSFIQWVFTNGKETADAMGFSFVPPSLQADIVKKIEAEAPIKAKE